MKDLPTIAREKVESLGFPPNPLLPAIPQLMLAVFNEDTPDNLDLDIYDRQDMANEISAMFQYSDKAVLWMLGLHNQDRYDEVRDQLEQANTEEEIRNLLVGKVLCDNLDYFPNNIWISPVEPLIQLEPETKEQRKQFNIKAVSQSRKDLPKRKKEHSLEKHRDNINNHMKKLQREAETKRKKLNGSRKSDINIPK